MVTARVEHLPVPLLFDEDIVVHAGQRRLGATLTVPQQAFGIVIFAHGSGSSRFSPRNRAVATTLQDAHLATLLLDLLTEDEEAEDRRSARLRFDVHLLGARLAQVTDWASSDSALADLPIGFFGSSTGAAAALLAASNRASLVAAVVSRGGRPDLAAGALRWVRSPTLLIVGELDTEVVALNRSAHEAMECEKELVIVPKASHLFEEEGALDRVAALSREWFTQYLSEAWKRRVHHRRVG